MTYGIAVHVKAPIEVYDAIHAEIRRRSGGDAVDGLILHVGRPTPDGFLVTEVWESQEQCSRYNDDIMAAMQADLGDGGSPPPESATEVFEVRGLVVPSAGVFD